MYSSILMLFLVLAIFLIFMGLQRKSRSKIILGLTVGIGIGVFFWFMNFWGEFLWFESLGYSGRFWKVALAKAGFTICGALFGLFLVHLFTISIPREKVFTRIISWLIGLFVGGNWGFAHWDTILQYVNSVATDLMDPILGRDTGFYMFSLPFYDALYSLVLALAAIGLITMLVAMFSRYRDGQVDFVYPPVGEGHTVRQYRSLYITAAVLMFVLAWGKFLDRYHLMYSSWGAVTGAGWTDVHIRLPAYNIVVVITAALGAFLLLRPLQNRVKNFLQRFRITWEVPGLFLLGMVALVTMGIWFLGLVIFPGVFQWVSVEPNEITYEKPYISHNIRFTRHGFGLHKIEEREFPASGNLTQEMIRMNENLFSNIRLWDWRALDAVYKQFQEIRLYYEFPDVDVDRYNIQDAYRQVMVSAREMEVKNLPEQSQTFVNKRFKYTHGYGITLNTVSEFTPEGLPNLLVKDIPPKSEFPELKVKVPQIYYGELTRTHVVVNAEEKEIDYPRGEKNVYIRYPGKGGVQLSNLWRKFLFGWKFDGTKFFLSSYPTPRSRIMFRRQIEERIEEIAPFLMFDDDPYIVLAEGRLYWIIDGYTTSSNYPYSEPFISERIMERKSGLSVRPGITGAGGSFHRINYIRNSVKVAVDAFNGSVDFYIFDPEDPILQVWDNVFPGLFKAREEMPGKLSSHVRYPADMLLIQGLVYAKYHMGDPAVFYNQEDLWVRATEKYYNEVKDVEPYYIMWEPPGKDELEFVLILPFTPKNRQVLIGWIAGMCDEENYGRFLAYKFPKEKRVLGTQQVETKIDQDRFLSGQLTLWDQRGSNVIRGNVLAIPIEKTLLYVEPIYLRAETAAYPELRLVVVMHGDNLSYGESFDEALKGLFKEGKGKIAPAEEPVAEKDVSLESLIRDANKAFEEYLELMGKKRFEESSRALERLEKILHGLKGRLGLSKTDQE